MHRKIIAVIMSVLICTTTIISPVYAKKDTSEEEIDRTVLEEDRVIKEWSDERKVDANETYAMTDWSVYQSMFDQFVRPMNTTMNASGIDPSIEKYGPQIEEILKEKNVINAAYYKQLMLGILQVLNDGQIIDKKDPFLTFAYVPGYIDPNRIAEISSTRFLQNDSEAVIMDIPYFCQWRGRFYGPMNKGNDAAQFDYKEWTSWRYNSDGDAIGTYACGPTSSAQVLSYLTGTLVTPVECEELIGPPDYAGAVIWSDLLSEFNRIKKHQKNGRVKCKILNGPNHYSEVLEHLRKGHPVIASTHETDGQNPFTDGDHFYLLTGATKDGRVTVGNCSKPQQAYCIDNTQYFTKRDVVGPSSMPYIDSYYVYYLANSKGATYLTQTDICKNKKMGTMAKQKAKYKVHGRIKTVSSAAESISVMFDYIESLFEAHNKQPGWNASIMNMDEECKSVIQAIVLGKSYTTKYKKYSKVSAKRYIKKHFDEYYGLTRSPVFCEKVASFMNNVTYGMGGVDSRGILQVPYFNQGSGYYQNGDWTNTDWPKVSYPGHSSYTLHTSGCGFCSKAMALSYLTGKIISPADLFVSDGTYDVGNGMYADGGMVAAAQMGIPARRVGRGDKAAVDAALKRGHPVMCHQGPGNFTQNGHYILIVGLTSDGRYAINDPGGCARSYFYNGTTWAWNDFDSTVREGDGAPYTIFGE